MEKELMRQLNSGKLKILMKGKKVKGEYALVKSHGREENAWLLMKLKDKYASKTDITKKEKSVQSGKTIKQVEATSNNIYGQNKAEAGTKVNYKAPKKEVSKKPAKQANAGSVEKSVSSPAKGVKAKFPENLEPMLATLVDKPFDEEGWQYEIKWDGYRALGYINKGKVTLRSRNNKSFDEKFYPVYDALKKWPINAVIDGEIIVANDQGIANFSRLQNWRSEADGNLLFYVFDILWLEGKSLMNLPLVERRKF
jgi:bifunctional non-homologous end joining protein LigD